MANLEGNFTVKRWGKFSISRHLFSYVIGMYNWIMKHTSAIEFGFLNLLAMSLQVVPNSVDNKQKNTCICFAVSWLYSATTIITNGTENRIQNLSKVHFLSLSLPSLDFGLIVNGLCWFLTIIFVCDLSICKQLILLSFQSNKIDHNKWKTCLTHWHMTNSGVHKFSVMCLWLNYTWQIMALMVSKIQVVLTRNLEWYVLSSLLWKSHHSVV